MAHEDFRFPDVVLDPAEQRIVELDWINSCRNEWRPDEDYQSAEAIRPNPGTGFAYTANANGTSGSRQPRWPTTLGAVVPDGSLIWTCVAAYGGVGLNAISAPSATAPAGITASSLTVVETRKLRVTYATTSKDGQDFDVPFTVTVAGIPRIGRQRVQVRTR